MLVLELGIDSSGPALERVLDAWPSYLAYLVSFLTIGAAWLAHSIISHNLQYTDAIVMRLNLILLLFVSLLPFPTRLVAEGIHETSDERVFVPMYGLTLLAIRLLLFAVDEYAHREGLFDTSEDEKDNVRRTILPVLLAYLGSILVGVLFPAAAVGLYCLLAIFLVIPFKELRRLLVRSP